MYAVCIDFKIFKKNVTITVNPLGMMRPMGKLGMDRQQEIEGNVCNRSWRRRHRREMK